jgi:UDP-N-acetyl-D-mannosaminuronate dehydrogenase
MKTILIGFGEIGKAFGKLMDRRNLEFSYVDINEEVIRYGEKHDIMLVNIPYSDKFIKQITDYATRFSPKTIIINSTVPVSTTEKLNTSLKEIAVVHSPVRGIHPNLTSGLIIFVKQIGCDDLKDYIVVSEFFKSIGITRTQLVKGSKNTELSKLISTTTYGIQIAWATEVKSICDEYGCDYDTVYTNSNKIYNDGYKMLQKPQYVKPLLIPNVGGFGGHCISNNTKLFNFGTLWKTIFKNVGEKHNE